MLGYFLSIYVPLVFTIVANNGIIIIPSLPHGSTKTILMRNYHQRIRAYITMNIISSFFLRVWSRERNMATKISKGTLEADQLITATRSGDMEKVREILEHGKCTVNCTDSSGWTPLHWACKKGHVDMVRVLVSEFKADMTIQTNFGATPLMLAAINKHDNVVHALLSESQCLVDAKDRDGYNALHFTCRCGHVDIVRTLVKHKANVNARTDSGDTPLTLAAKNKHDSVVHALSDYNCEVYAEDMDTYTALLHSSCERGYVGIVQTLLNEHKADINLDARTKHGDTPLTCTAINKHDNVVHALLSDYECPVDVKGQGGYTALHYSCRYGHVDIVRTLVKHKANVNARTDSGDTPLTLAAINKHDNVVHALSDYNCEVLAKDKDAYTALLNTSCERGYVGIVRTLVTEHKADIGAKTNSGDTPLHVAARYGQLQVTIALINELNCDINVKGQLGRSLLHSACACLSYRSDGAIVEDICHLY